MFRFSWLVEVETHLESAPLTSYGLPGFLFDCQQARQPLRPNSSEVPKD